MGHSECLLNQCSLNYSHNQSIFVQIWNLMVIYYQTMSLFSSLVPCSLSTSSFLKYTCLSEYFLNPYIPLGCIVARGQGEEFSWSYSPSCFNLTLTPDTPSTFENIHKSALKYYPVLRTRVYPHLLLNYLGLFKGCASVFKTQSSKLTTSQSSKHK